MLEDLAKPLIYLGKLGLRMRFLILADIHSNLEALEAVLKQASNQFDQVICCGDVVGYGPNPNEVTEIVRKLNPVVLIRGNHEKAALGLIDLSLFNPLAKRAALWTQEQLSEGTRDYLNAIPSGPAENNGFRVVHGSLLDEDQYVVNLDDALQSFRVATHTVNFFGHTHVQGGFIWFKNQKTRLLNPELRNGVFESQLTVDSENKYLINPGSVGQPRDGDARSAFAILDQKIQVVRYFRVEYSIGLTQQKMRQAELPQYLVDRLGRGR